MSASTNEMTSINPLIDANGDTFIVSSVLTAIAVMIDREQSGMAIDGAQAFGLSMILQTCAAALRHMGEIK